MNIVWRVAAFEYGRNVFKKSFIFSLLSIPLFIAFSLGLGFFLESRKVSSQPVGYVDHAGILNEARISPAVVSSLAAGYDDPVSFLAFQTEAEAEAALETGDIQAYFVLPADHLLTRQVDVVYAREPGQNIWRQFYDLLQAGLLAGQPPQLTYRAIRGTDFIVRSIDGRREVPASSGPTFALLMPLFIALAFLFMLLMSSGYTMSAVADEKENRTMEVLVTSISPTQLIGGKVLGIAGISLTLLFFWTVLSALGIFIGRQAGVGWFSDLGMDWRTVIAIAAIAIPSYVLATAVMTAIGAIVSTTQEGQSVSTIIFILHAFPLYVSWSFLNDPHSSLAVWLSLLPFSSLMTVGMRNLFTIVPPWQVAVSVGIQAICALGAIWLAGRAFRFGMLRYGQRLNVRRLFGRS